MSVANKSGTIFGAMSNDTSLLSGIPKEMANVELSCEINNFNKEQKYIPNIYRKINKKKGKGLNEEIGGCFVEDL